MRNNPKIQIENDSPLIPFNGENYIKQQVTTNIFQDSKIVQEKQREIETIKTVSPKNLEERKKLIPEPTFITEEIAELKKLISNINSPNFKQILMKRGVPQEDIDLIRQSLKEMYAGDSECEENYVEI
ncbi:MAG: hypothetical protein LBL17_02710 [Coxiellaceae bacterium]|jgi:hypothetical protein|nr:hypothetical protein [Coxiellaceae bacterium]